jgi:hypothetical protein
VSLAIQLEIFQALAEVNRNILECLRQESGSEALEPLFAQRQTLLERIVAHPLTAHAISAAAPETRQALAQAQLAAAREESKVAELLAELVSSIGKSKRYHEGLKPTQAPGKQRDWIG